MSEPNSQLPSVERRSILPMFVLGIVMIALFLGAGWWLRAAISSGSPEEAVRAEARRENLKTLTETDQVELTTYGWVDEAKGVVRLPIDRAMEMEIAVLNSRKPQAAYPVATPAAAAPAAPAGDVPAPTDPAAGAANLDRATPAVTNPTDTPAAAEAPAVQVPAEAAPAPTTTTEPAATPAAEVAP